MTGLGANELPGSLSVDSANPKHVRQIRVVDFIICQEVLNVGRVAARKSSTPKITLF
jgi:hypothetical protein